MVSGLCLGAGRVCGAEIVTKPLNTPSPSLLRVIFGAVWEGQGDPPGDHRKEMDLWARLWQAAHPKVAVVLRAGAGEVFLLKATMSEGLWELEEVLLFYCFWFFLLLFLILLVKLYSISRWVELLKVEGRPGADLTGCSEMWQ